MIGVMYTFILSLIVLISLSLSLVPFREQVIQPFLGYRYGYVTNQGGVVNLHLIDPEVTTQENQIVTLPIAANDFVSEIVASPNGEWISFVVGPDDNSVGLQIRLFNALTGEVRDMLVRDRFNGISWSLDSRYLAINSNDAELSPIEYGTYIYDVQADKLNYVLNGDTNRYGLSWSSDSTRLAVASYNCSQNSCQGQLDIVNIPNYVAVNSTPFNTIGDRLCGFSWSPNNRYFSFVFSCGDGQSPYISDVFTLDTVTNKIRQITTFSQDYDVFMHSTEPGDLFRNFYDLIWADSTHLLVGVTAGQFSDGIGYNPSKMELKTNIYHPDGSSLQVSNATFTGWVRNPVENMIAFRSEQKVLYSDEQNMPQLTNQDVSVQVATFNGDRLQILYTQSINGCDLSWSPDGVYLAYDERRPTYSDYSDCITSLMAINRFDFLNQVSGQINKFEVAGDNPRPLGWIAVASSSLN